MAEEKSKSKNQRDIIVSVMRSKFNEYSDSELYPSAALGVEINLSELKNACKNSSRSKIDPNTKSFRPYSVDYVKNDVLPSMILEYGFSQKEKGLTVKSEAGMFAVRFTDNSVMMFAQRIVGMGRNQSVETYALATRQTLNKYYSYLNRQAKINSKPKVGLFKISVKSSPMGDRLNYTPIKGKMTEKKVYHQNKKLVENDVEQFFDNVNLYTRFNQPGSRRLLLVGEPGGGKTSAANEIAMKLSEKMCVVIATDLKAVMMHTYNISKAEMPTLIILEDAESTIPWGNSDVLNYLDGINQPRTTKGCYMILTTNYPQRIEPRVLKRPGRIDKIIKFGVLDQVNSIMCAKHYFEGILFDSNKDKASTVEEMLKQVYEKIIAVDNETGMTGAQIKNLSEATISYAISNNTEKINIDTIIAVRDQLSKDLKDVYEMADDESMSANKPSPIGFDISDGKRKNTWEESLDWDSIINPEKSKGNDLSF
jgi:hypothetical protein